MNFYSKNSIRLLPKSTLKQKILNCLFKICKFLKQIKFKFCFKCYECKKIKFELEKHELYYLNKHKPGHFYGEHEYKRVCKKCYNDVPF